MSLLREILSLRVANNYGPKVCNTVSRACKDVVYALMRLIDDLIPLTAGRRSGEDRLPMPQSLKEDGLLWAASSSLTISKRSPGFPARSLR